MKSAVIELWRTPQRLLRRQVASGMPSSRLNARFTASLALGPKTLFISNPGPAVGRMWLARARAGSAP